MGPSAGNWRTRRPEVDGEKVWRLDAFRDLLVHVDGGEAGRRRVQFAVHLMERLGARLSGLHVTPPMEVPPYKPSRIAEAAAKISSKLALDASAAGIVFKEETIGRSADARWFEAEGDVARGISDKARYADLVILGQYEWQGPPESHPLPIAHSVVLQCGRPVLVVPAEAQLCALEKIAIAWDGSREAVRAVHDALPLLRLSQWVQIVTMVRPSAEHAEIDARSLSTHLANHGITLGRVVLQIRSAEEPASLRERIEQEHFDLLVMGGYSHPRWLEFIFGGVTSSILLSSKIPVLVSH
jgi:nucleotide-binding universal stress UspA family protein